MKQASTNKRFSCSLIFSALVLASGNLLAEEVQDMFLYQANTGASQNDFIRSNVEGLFDGQHISKKITDQFSVDVIGLKTMHKELDSSHRNTLESMTSVDVNFASQWFSRIQLGSSREDIYTFNQSSDVNTDQQRMYSLAQGWKAVLGDVKTETYLGLVQCSMDGEQKYYPVFGLKLGKTFKNDAELSLNAAQEIQGGGSYTGIYGNQVFRKMMVMGRVPLLKRLSFLWDAGIGISQSSFSENNSSIGAGVSTMSASLEYEIGNNIKGVFGYSHRKLIDKSQAGIGNAEGHMMSASLSIANF